MRGRGGSVGNLIAVVTVLAAAGLLSVPSAPASTSPAAPDVYVDPGLLEQLGGGPAPALLTWDESVASEAELSAYLADKGISATILDGFQSAIACVSALSTLEGLAGAPGARSIYGDAPLTPTLDRSVRTAFNGDPAPIWTSLGATGKGVGIAVLDTGVDATHPDLRFGTRTKENVRIYYSHKDILGPPNEACPSVDLYSGTMDDTELTSGHGTHMASVAAGDGTASGGRYRGMAPEADIMGVGIADAVMDPQVRVAQVQPTLLAALGGLYFVKCSGVDDPTQCPPTFTQLDPVPRKALVKVILAGWTVEGLHDPWHPIPLAIKELHDLYIVTVFPTGNEGPEMSNCSAAATCHMNPFAVGPYAVAVGATPKLSRSSLATYSSRGDPVPRESREELFSYVPTVVAPGTGVVAARRVGLDNFMTPPTSVSGAHGEGRVGTDLDYASLTGTSVAAAHVAGAIAVMQEAAIEAKGCYLTATQVVRILRETATPVTGYDTWEVGAGALDATAAAYYAAFEPPVRTLGEPWHCP